MMDPILIDRARYATCAIGWLSCSVEELELTPLKPHLQIVGTGFLTSQQVVVTARHVLTGTLQARTLNGTPGNELVVAFYLQKNDDSIDLRVHRWGRYGWMNAPLDDLGAIRIEEFDETALLRMPPLPVVQRFSARIGSPVGTFGFLFGTHGLIDQQAEGGPRLYRVGPVFQQGHISAFAPFDHADRVNRILLDIRTSRGMSGSAVFDVATGEAIGVHTGGFATDPATLAFAAPLDGSVLEVMFAQLSRPRGSEETGSTRVPIELPFVRRYK